MYAVDDNFNMSITTCCSKERPCSGVGLGMRAACSKSWPPQGTRAELRAGVLRPTTISKWGRGTSGVSSTPPDPRKPSSAPESSLQGSA